MPKYSTYRCLSVYFCKNQHVIPHVLLLIRLGSLLSLLFLDNYYLNYAREFIWRRNWVNMRSARRGGRAVECTGLENRQRWKPFEGSNPSSSAIFSHEKAVSSDYQRPAFPVTPSQCQSMQFLVIYCQLIILCKTCSKSLAITLSK